MGGDRKAEADEGQPQGRHEIRKRRGGKGGAVHRPPAGLGDEACVLQVALAPAAVALQLVEQVRRVLLPAAAQLRRDPHLVAGARHHRRLDEIVREDFAGEAAAPRQPGERAVLHEGLDAQDGVVTPVVRVAELPEGHAEAEQATGDAVRELLRARVQRAVAAGLRQRLHDAGARVCLHQPHERDERVAVHGAVGV